MAEMERVKSRSGNIYVSLGYSEKHGGSQYIAQILISIPVKLFARGANSNRHMSSGRFLEDDGSDLVVDDTPLGRLGALCCWDIFSLCPNMLCTP